jgi:hypothetical protein
MFTAVITTMTSDAKTLSQPLQALSPMKSVVAYDRKETASIPTTTTNAAANPSHAATPSRRPLPKPWRRYSINPP